MKHKFTKWSSQWKHIMFLVRYKLNLHIQKTTAVHKDQCAHLIHYGKNEVMGTET